jgi:hypothetical protein
MKTGHRKDECPSDNTCTHCAKRGLWRQHNSALCNSPDAIAARLQHLHIDWKQYKATQKSDPTYAKYKAQLRKKRLEKPNQNSRVHVAQLAEQSEDSSDEEDEDVPVGLESSDAESPSPKPAKDSTKESQQKED